MSTYKILLADDEPEARLGLQSLVARDPSLTLTAVCSNGLEALQAIEEHKPDIALLDIQMPGISGLDLVRSLSGALPQIIFITAYDQYAINAFEEQALDYLLKPFSDERFFKSLERAKELAHLISNQQLADKIKSLLQNSANEPDRLIQTADQKQRLVLKVSGKVLMVSHPSIEFLEADNYVTRIYYDGKVAVVRQTLKSLEEHLPASIFIRTHKSFIVNVQKIQEIETAFSGGLLLKLASQAQIPVSKSYRTELQQKIGLK